MIKPRKGEMMRYLSGDREMALARSAGCLYIITSLLEKHAVIFS